MPGKSLFKTVNGRHQLSLLASRWFEKSGVKRLFGLNLLAAVVFAGVVSPQASNVVNQFVLEKKFTDTPVSAQITTRSTFEIPLTNYRISQLFSFWHPGIDMVTPVETPIYAIEAGVVEYAGNMFFGYGKHVLVAHEHGVTSLYGHMSEIDTVTGRRVARGELLGRVGATGWATGDHLHLEIHYNHVPINPLEILPIKPEEVQYDGAFSAKTSSPSATPISL